MLPRGLVHEIRSYRPIVKKIIDVVVHGAEQNVTYNELASFVDRFGARPSGSKALEHSIDYMVDILRGQRLDSVHTEEASIINWRRGHEEAWIVRPRKKKMSILGLGGSVATPAKGIEAPVLVVKSFEDLRKNAKKAKGKIVVFNQAYVSYSETIKYRVNGATEAAKAGAVAALVRSVTPLSINSPHTGFMVYDNNTPRIPTASITVEDAELLARFQGRGRHPVIKLVMRAKRLPPGISRNTIVEIRGRSKPEEIVLLSGHLDSWDVGQGAMDDGAGGFHLVEGSRCASAPGPQASAHAACHPLRWRGTSVLVALWPRYSVCLPPINATQLTLGVSEPDIGPWIQKGVPALSLNTVTKKYFYFHHTEGDTMSVLDRHELDLCTALWAAASYIFADLSIRLPR
ncbi:hypothetical protein MRX96_056094 [Rhipicephalus microplus]